jgi:hypothetical protein
MPEDPLLFLSVTVQETSRGPARTYEATLTDGERNRLHDALMRMLKKEQIHKFSIYELRPFGSKEELLGRIRSDFDIPSPMCRRS